jgi:hypothetical protein
LQRQRDRHLCSSSSRWNFASIRSGSGGLSGGLAGGAVWWAGRVDCRIVYVWYVLLFWVTRILWCFFSEFFFFFFLVFSSLTLYSFSVKFVSSRLFS